jgi:hypothetical protein
MGAGRLSVGERGRHPGASRHSPADVERRRKRA